MPNTGSEDGRSDRRGLHRIDPTQAPDGSAERSQNSTHHGGDPALPTMGTTGQRDRLHYGGGRGGVEARRDLALLQTHRGQRDQRLETQVVGSQADPDEVGVLFGVGVRR